MNHALDPGEPDMPDDATPGLPVAFVFGLPRSGTTLLTQVLAWSLAVGYVDSIAARFWRAPAQGLALSRSILGGRRGAGRSDLA